MNLTVTILSQIAPIPPAISGFVSSDPTKLAPPSFDWLTFFWGGAVGAFTGALIILGVERILDWIISSRKFRKEKEQITNALKLELSTNLRVCNQILELINNEPEASHIFASFDNTWLDVYSSKFLDLTNKDHISLFGDLSGTAPLIGEKGGPA